ncbi:transglycosylase SLT domain-containing protein [Neisseriaceae bacterium JH1-16]|nr:transglycosylase SLT domain-containing protein [Neisseriaceae bacterium JH1-16]
MGNAFVVNPGSAQKDGAATGNPVLGTAERIPTDKGYNAMIAETAQKYGVPVGIALRQADQESGHFDPNVITGKKKSGAGATGMFQFMPITISDMKQRFGLKNFNANDPAQATDGAMRYLAYLYKRFKDWKTAVWAYNLGEGTVDKYLKGKIKTLPEETRQYGLILVDGLTNDQAKATGRNVL